MRNYFRYLKKYIVFIIFLFSTTVSWAGAYEDFFSAIMRDDARAIESLIQRGFDPNTPDPNGYHGLFLAIRESSFNAARALLNAPKINVNPITAQGETPLMLAVFRGEVALAKQLIEMGADINKTGWTPLHYAATIGHVQLTAMMLEHHAYIDAESPNRTTPLMMAAHYGTASVVKLLLEAGADVSLKNDLGMTALDFAQQANKTDSVEIIAAFIRARHPRGRW